MILFIAWIIQPNRNWGSIPRGNERAADDLKPRHSHEKNGPRGSDLLLNRPVGGKAPRVSNVCEKRWLSCQSHVCVAATAIINLKTSMSDMI